MSWKSIFHVTMMALLEKWIDVTTKTFVVVSADQENVKKKKERETDMEMLEMNEYPGETEPGK